MWALRAATVLAVITSASSAEAADEAPLGGAEGGGQVELAGEVAYTSPPIRGGTSPFGTGFGARLGVGWEHLYLGVNGMAYLGATDVTIKDRSFMGGVELGYSVSGRIGGPRLTFRPLVGLGGVAILHTDPSLAQAKADVVSSASRQSSTSDTTTIGNVYLRPALVLLISSGSVFAGVDAGVLVLPGVTYSGDSATWLSYGLKGQVGCSF